MKRRIFLPLTLAIFASTGESRAQTAEMTAFLIEARQGTSAYHNAENAVRDGFVPIGPDAPAMGRHWVNIGRVLDGRFEPGRPSVLTYIERENDLVLVGVAYAMPLSPGEQTPGPFPQSAWHVHAGSVSDEGALFGHDMAPTEVQRQRGVAVLHVWAWSTNPHGLVAADNWALPFLRRSQEPPTREPGLLRAAALGLALADGADAFLIEVLTRHHLTDEVDRQKARRILADHARLQRERMSHDLVASVRDLAHAWEACWDEILSAMSAQGRMALRRLDQSHADHRSH